MRSLIAATLAASLFSTSLFAAEVNAPLPAGHAAGVKQADLEDSTFLWIVGAAAVIAIIAVAASSGNGNSPTPAASSTGTG